MAAQTQPSFTPVTPRPAWTLLSNHGRVLACLAREPRMRIRDLAESVGITERACYRIVGDLVHEGLLRRERVGRNNRYRVELAAAENHPCSVGLQVGHLLDAG
ncbi:MAG: winged helix-turn-helix domain-containing protein [Candidatus Dormiibacterota bacterium]